MTTDAALKSSTTRHAFGVDRLAAITALRELADAIEARTALPQEIVTTETVTIDDFAMTTLSVKYAPRNPDHAPERIRSMENVTATWDTGLPAEGWEPLAPGVTRYAPPIASLTGWTIADPADVAKSVTMAEAFGGAHALPTTMMLTSTMDESALANLHRVFPIVMPNEGETVH